MYFHTEQAGYLHVKVTHLNYYISFTHYEQYNGHCQEWSQCSLWFQISAQEEFVSLLE